MAPPVAGRCAAAPTAAITSALTATGYATAPAGAGGFELADAARRRLRRVCRELDGSRDLVIDLPKDGCPRWFFASSSSASIARNADRLSRLKEGSTARHPAARRGDRLQQSPRL
jgi:hypothetical protein